MTQICEYSPELILYAANKFYKEKNYQEALNYYTMYLKKKPKDKKALVYKGICFSRNKDYKSAEKCFKRAISLAPRYAFAYYCYGILEYKIRHLMDALALFNHARLLKEQDPKNNSIPDNVDEFINICFHATKEVSGIVTEERIAYLDWLHKDDFSL
jgi:tetratricopeptide (TPR) repeat protein